MSYTVKQLADLANISRRTLHYYDEIGLLKPETVAPNGYRGYSELSLFRLQQILFYRELGFSLDEIHQIFERPDFDLLQALEAQRSGLLGRRARLERLIQTVEMTIGKIKGAVPMADQQLFEGFSSEQEKEYAHQAVERWGEDAAQSIHRWHTYGKQKQAAILAESGAIYQELVGLLEQEPHSPQVQELIARWHQNLRNFYEPSKGLMLRLADMYVEAPDFRATFDRFHVDLAPFMRRAIQHYCARLD